MVQVGNASGGRLEYIDARIAGPDPDASVCIHQQRMRGIARERIGIGRIVTVDGKAVAGAAELRGETT